MQFPLIKVILLFVLLSYTPINLVGQVEGKLIQLADSSIYQVIITPYQSLSAPNNITNTGQITLKASTGTFDLSEFEAINGLWQFNSRINHPAESPDFDYIIFNLTTPLLNPIYEENTDFPLFQFKNSLDCSGTIELIKNGVDRFWPPNSLQANIGNHLTIFGFGVENAYQKNKEEASKITCSKPLKFTYRAEPPLCTDFATRIVIHFIEGIEPFNYEIMLDNQMINNGTLPNRGDSIALMIPLGNPTLIGLNLTDTIIEPLNLSIPVPLEIEIINQEEIGCEDYDGARILVQGKGSLVPDTYKYEWSNGETGAIVEGLSAETYTVTLTDANECFVIKEITIEEILPLKIGRMEMFTPTCFNRADGIVDVIKILNATPPIQYALNKDTFQTDNYFENLKEDTYRLHIKDANNCRLVHDFVLSSPPPISLELPADTSLYLGQSYVIRPKTTSQTDLIYEWASTPFLSCIDCAKPTIKPTSNYTVDLKIIDEYGCEVSAQQEFTIIKSSSVYIPTAFSPNNDGINDLFEIHHNDQIKRIKNLSIFNRWGQLVFQDQSTHQNTTIVWDGTFRGKWVEEGIYLYVAEIELLNGEIELYKGDFSVLK